MIIGIYKITSPSGKIYIGSSTNVLERWRYYKNIWKPVKGQSKLYKSLKKYGSRNHTFEILEECPIEYLNKLEVWWKMFYGYQCVENGLCCNYWDINKNGLRDYQSKETRKIINNKISIGNKGKKKPGAGRGKWNEEQIKNYPSRFKKEDWSDLCKRPVLQYDKKGNFIKEYSSQTEAGIINKIKQGDISTCCHGKQKTAGGYIWKFKNILKS